MKNAIYENFMFLFRRSEHFRKLKKKKQDPMREHLQNIGRVIIIMTIFKRMEDQLKKFKISNKANK